MLHRLCQLPRDRSCLLLGPRQTGKSTLVRSQLGPDAWTIDLLQRDVFERLSKEPARFRAEVEEKFRSGVRTVFVDEIQKIPELLDEVHGLMESHQSLRFLLTGSSARKLKRRGTNLLGGRAVTRTLHPLTVDELGSRFDLDRVLRLGSLPPVATADDDTAIDTLRSYTQTYLREEIQAEALVRNLGGFARFLDVVAAQNGELVNASAVARDAGLATRTVQQYYQLLEDTLIGFRLEAWGKSPRARLVAHPRFHLFDTGVTNAINLRLTAALDPASRGRLFEQWFVLECRRRIDYSRAEARLFFWRTHGGAEVDLLIEKHGKLRAAIEIKSTRQVSGADLTGLRSFQEAHPEVPTWVASSAPEPYALGQVRVLPWRQCLEQIDGILAS